MARVGSARTVIAQAPRYLLQGVAFGGMLLIILGMLIGQSASLGTILPLLAVYAFAGLQAAAGGAAGLPGGHLDALQPAGAGVAAQGHHGHPRPRRRAGRDQHRAAAAARPARADRRALFLPAGRARGAAGLEPQHPGAYHRRHRRQHRRRQDHRGRPDPRAAGHAEGHARGRRPADHAPRTSAPGRTTSATCRRRSF